MNRPEFLQSNQLTLDDRGRSASTSYSKQHSTQLLSLNHWSQLRIEGLDARKFLQGQLSCNVDIVSASHGVYGALCTPKGRMVCNFYLQQGDNVNCLIMTLPTSTVDVTLTTLKKYIVFSKAEIVNISDERHVFGLIGPKAAALLNIEQAQRLQQSQHNSGSILCLTPQRFLISIRNDDAQAQWHKLLDNADVGPGCHWELGDIQDGLGMVFSETSEQFIPQMLNMQLTDGISFDKGCYTGQEIIARTQYRGKIKRHMQRFTTQTENLPTPNQALYTIDTDKAFATVVSAEYNVSGDAELLAVVNGPISDAGLRLEDGTAVKQAPLPYPLPDDEQ